MLTQQQKRDFSENGFLHVTGVVPQVMIEAARRKVYHSIGNVGIGGEDLENHRSGYFCAELMADETITDMYNKTPVFQIAEDLMGEGKVQPVHRAKTYPRFPLALGEEPEFPRGHIDGIGSGTNGQAKGNYSRGFTAFAVVYLQDVDGPFSGNFTVWPKTHSFYEDYFKEHGGHEILKEGMPRAELPEEPIMVTGKAGDLVFAHHAMVHGACQNGSANVRLATIARIRHVDVEANGADVYLDIWREWDGVRELLEEEVAA
ncbi:MAG: hypothetical protein CME19_07275 [Gemmatimonadetes bacterium]|nr:hypothetical protein [Gemmatimonadota bacterium]|tara:strand:+ start:38 stop:817 length:780 start_codon:yes stop_codon:yes gene_type:complete